MSDELDRAAGVPVNRLFERKDHEHAIGNGLNRLDATGPPRPDLRADVVDDRNPKRLEVAGEADIEAEIVDDDEDVWTVGSGGRHEATFGRIQGGERRDDFRETGDGEPAIIGEQPAAAPNKLGAAASADFARRRKRVQLARECASIEIARRFTARQKDS